MESALTLLAGLSLVGWLYLVFAHARFWQGDQRLEGAFGAPERWPSVVALVPARDEADVIERTLGSLLDQDYPGPFRIVLVDDESEDGTGKAAELLAAAHPRGDRAVVEPAAPRPGGWVGKMWALQCGVRRAEREVPDAEYWLLTDADVLHSPGNLRGLMGKALSDRRELVSLMVRLCAERGWERLLVPAFVYFFQKLYPFPAVNDPKRRAAGAAGGCVLVRRDALARAGGFEALRGEIIDDCALGRAVKQGGSIWVGLTRSERSIRSYGGLRGVWRMVVRSAFTQLRHSQPLLVATVLGLALLYLVPPLLALAAPLHGNAVAGLLAASAWLAMAVSFAPTLALYDRSAWWGLALPVAGLLYAGMTLDSARRHRRAEGALWKGRRGAGGTPASGSRGRP